MPSRRIDSHVATSQPQAEHGWVRQNLQKTNAKKSCSRVSSDLLCRDLLCRLKDNQPRIPFRQEELPSLHRRIIGEGDARACFGVDLKGHTAGRKRNSHDRR